MIYYQLIQRCFPIRPFNSSSPHSLHNKPHEDLDAVSSGDDDFVEGDKSGVEEEHSNGSSGTGGGTGVRGDDVVSGAGGVQGTPGPPGPNDPTASTPLTGHSRPPPVDLSPEVSQRLETDSG